MAGNLLVITGPSGVGKGTIITALFKELKNLVYSVSVTTRSPRKGEEEGKNYFFCNPEAFKKMVAGGQLLEWAEFVGNYYGTPKDQVQKSLAAGQDVLLEIEMEGARQIKQQMNKALFIFIAPPNLQTLEKRLQERSSEDSEIIEKRLKKAEEEIAASDWVDYKIINEEGKLIDSIHKLKQIILLQRTQSN